MTTPVSHCCYLPPIPGSWYERYRWLVSLLGCKRRGMWTIVDGLGLESHNYTESCTKHVGVLLTDADSHRIFRA